MAAPAARIPAFDGVRGLACLIVLVVHATSASFPDLRPYLAGVGKIGVWLFFVLSGYLLAIQLVSRGFTASTIADYFAARILRILPIYVFGVLFYYYFDGVGIDTMGDVVKALTFQAGYQHLWTIPVEFLTYFAIPPLVYVLTKAAKRFGVVVAGLLTAFVLATHQAFFPYWDTPENSVEPVWYFPVFLLAVSAAVLAPKICTGNRTGAANLIAAASATSVAAIIAGFWALLDAVPPKYLMDKFIYFGIAWTLLVVAVHQGARWWAALFERAALRWVGAASYSVYIIHYYFVVNAPNWVGRNGASFALIIVCALIAGGLMERFLERPCEILRKWFREEVIHRTLNANP